jgi:hypothetical protein
MGYPRGYDPCGGVEKSVDDGRTPILNDQGELVGIVLIFRDIQEGRLAEREKEVLARSPSKYGKLQRTQSCRLTEAGTSVTRMNRRESRLEHSQPFPAIVSVRNRRNFSSKVSD